MLRNIDLKDISDGHLYDSNELARTDCNGCVGCSACCTGMEDTIVLDPYDVFNLCRAGLGDNAPLSFEGLLNSGRAALRVIDNLILPLLIMEDPDHTCPYLNSEGRCSIHDFRPGICRLFPLSRIYDDDSDDFKYFIQIHECPAPKSKIRIRKWIGIQNYPAYERFVKNWHHILKENRKKAGNDPFLIKAVSMDMINKFYLEPYDLSADFFEQFEKRM